MADFQTAVTNLFKTADYTNQCNKADIDSNKVMGVLAYLGLLFLVPLLAAKKSPFARFHTNQGVVLFLASLAVGAVQAILGGIPILGILIVIACLFIELLFFAFAILGIVNAACGKAKDLPFIGKIRLLK